MAVSKEQQHTFEKLVKGRKKERDNMFRKTTAFQNAKVTGESRIRGGGGRLRVTVSVVSGVCCFSTPPHSPCAIHVRDVVPTILYHTVTVLTVSSHALPAVFRRLRRKTRRWKCEGGV